MVQKEIVALLLAGGQGSRLGIMTTGTAKPAVPYGGKYRIIDFPLSNCVNSGIDTVGVFTQYEPLELNAHIGIGKPWDLDRINGGVTILSPYQKSQNSDWFTGTANAVFQNIQYTDKLDPEYVIILSGDHIYKMDYSKMLEFHKENNADATISVYEVPIEEASRFGIMNTKKDGEIYEFEEKPEKPKSNLASMGVYIFTWKILREYLINDEKDPNSNNDFGKNILPTMLGDGKKLYAYKFSGYWKDVGTIEAYWESHMDLIKRVPEFNLFDHEWKIFTVNPVKPANYIGPASVTVRSIIAEGCMVYGTVRNSIVFPGVYIEEGAIIEDSIIMSNSYISKDAHIVKSILCENVRVEPAAYIGLGEEVVNIQYPHLYNCGITLIGENAFIPANTVIGKNVVVDRHITADDFKTTHIASGESIMKGGQANA